MSTCAKCGVQSRLEQAFVEGCCPRCVGLAREGHARFSIVCLVVTPAIVLSMELAGAGAPYWLLNAWGACVVVLAVQPLHELGHALGAWLVGGQVLALRLGVGPAILRTRVGAVSLEVRAYPWDGATHAAIVTRRWYRARRIGFILGGPLAVLLLLAAVLWAAPRGALSWAGSPRSFDAWWAVVAGCIFSSAQNLLPRRGDFVASDGLQFWRALTNSGAELARERELMCVALIAHQIQRRNVTEALLGCERALAEGSDSWLIRDCRAVALTYAGRWPEAQAEYDGLLADGRVDPPNRALLRNNLAFNLLLHGTPADLSRADVLSAEAFQDLPWYAPVKGTRGCVLIEKGELEQGLALVRTALIENEGAEIKALDACYLAIGFASQGSRDEALGQLDLARRLDPACALLTRATARVQGAAGR